MNDGKSEFKLIDWIKSHRGPLSEDVVTDIGDDMAVMRCGNEPLLVTTDMLLEGVHFDLNTATLKQVGYKTMACSLSDCAAMASVPFVAVVAVALPKTISMDAAMQIHEGLNEAATRYQCPIVGGDTTSWDNPLAINVTMLSRRGVCEPVLRSGSQVGDRIFVTGELGGSIEGRHLRFEPRVQEAQQFAEMVNLHAMIDLSDGLASDLGHICQKSGVSARIIGDAIPASPAALRQDNPVKAAVSDGEDFELLFTVSAEDGEKLKREWPQKSELKLTEVGVITEANGLEYPIEIEWLNGDVEPLTLKGWEHFC